MIAADFVRFVEAVPGLGDALGEVARSVYRFAAENDVNELNPLTIVSPEGKMVVDLLGGVDE